MASSRRLPISYNVSTYDSAGGKDYSVLSTWEQATDNDLVTATAGEVLDCYRGVHNQNDELNGATCNSSYFRVIRAASGEGHSGIPKSDGSVVCFARTFTGRIFEIGENYSQIQDIVITASGTTSSPICIIGADGNNAAFVGVLAFDINYTDGNVYAFYNSVGAGNAAYFINCLCHNVTASAVGRGFYSVTGDGYFYNCTAQGCEYGFSGNCTVKNCLADASSLNDYKSGDSYTATTCGSSDSTSPTVALRNQSYSFVAPGSDDFHLQSGSDGVDDGTNLSSDSNYSFDDDIDGDTRSGTWDIGFDEYTPSGQFLTQDIAWQVLDTIERNSGWSILAAKTADSGYRILNAINRDIAARILTATDQDTAHKILNAITRDIASKIFTGLDRDSSWAIKAAKDQITGYRIMAAKDQGTAWGIVNAVTRDAAWSILNVKDQQTAWGIFTRISLDTSWKVFTVTDQDLAWGILTHLEQDTGWQLFDAISLDTAWDILSGIVPDPIKIFMAEERTFTFNAKRYTFIFNAERRTFIFFA